jgi:hypothetical protein
VTRAAARHQGSHRRACERCAHALRGVRPRAAMGDRTGGR